MSERTSYDHPAQTYTDVCPENGATKFGFLNKWEKTNSWFYKLPNGEFGCYPAAHSSIFEPERTDSGYEKTTVAEIRNGPLLGFYSERFMVNSNTKIAMRQIERRIHKLLADKEWKRENARKAMI
jgi:hypothetical protein